MSIDVDAEISRLKLVWGVAPVMAENRGPRLFQELRQVFPLAKDEFYFDAERWEVEKLKTGTALILASKGDGDAARRKRARLLRDPAPAVDPGVLVCYNGAAACRARVATRVDLGFGAVECAFRGSCCSEAAPAP